MKYSVEVKDSIGGVNFYMRKFRLDNSQVLLVAKIHGD